VHHIALIAIAEHARSQWLDAAVASETTWPYVVVRVAFDYRAQIKFEDRFVRCAFKTARVGNSSVTLTETLSTRDGTVVAKGQSVIVSWDEEKAAAKPLLPAEIEGLNARK
jgi:acyl-CoA thioesterase FadM